MRILPTFKGYTIDYRLREFRRAVFGEQLVFIPFATEEGRRLLDGVGQDQQLVIREEAGTDDWVCVCGNRPDADGFFPCDPSGERVEPTPGAWPSPFWPRPFYICDRCGRIIDADTLAVVSLDTDARERAGR